MTSNDEEIHLLDYWRILKKRRRVAFIFFGVVVGIVAVYLLVATPYYMGTAQLLVPQEQNQTLDFDQGGTTVIQSQDPTIYFNTQKEIIQSRAFADRVVRKLQLDRNPYFKDLKDKRNNRLIPLIIRTIKKLLPETKAANPLPDIKLKDELDPDMTDIILDKVDMEIGKQDNIMKIDYYADNPIAAAAMANGIAEAFIEHNLEIKVKPYRNAVDWLTGRITESRSKVEETERMLQQYREGTGMTSFETKESVLNQKLQELMTQLVQTESKRQESEIKYNQIKSVIDRPELLATVPDIMNNLVIQGLRNDELNLRKQLSDLSEKYGPKHPQIIKATSQLDMVRKNIISEARKMLNAAKADYEVARNRESSLRREMDEQKQEVLSLSRKAIDFNVIAGQSGSNKQFYELLLKKFQEASLSSGINISNAQVVDYATIPKSRAKPKRSLLMAIALIVGLFGGVFAAFFTEYMDDTIKNADDVNKTLGLPFLDVVPLTEKRKGPLFMDSNPKSATAESYRTIRTGVMLSSPGKQLKMILVTSATPNEGKTTTAANLAIAMAQMDEKVLLIDADMRRHNLHELFGVSNTVGISEAIVDSNKIPSAIKSVARCPNLDVITGGTLAPNPSELLGSLGMTELIARVASKYDRIILDSPPLLAFSDSLVLSRLADGVIMVVWGGETGRNLIKQSIDSLKGVDAKIIGVVLNKIDTNKHGYSYYPYYSHYYPDKKDTPKKKKR